MLTDAYSHCGLSKYRPVEDVLAVMKSAGVERAVLCQHLGEYDNSYLARVVEQHPETFAAAYLVDPSSEGAIAELERWHATGRFRGVRLHAKWLADHERLYARAVGLGLNLVIYAPDGMPAAAPLVRRFCRNHADARVVVTHLGNPVMRDVKPSDGELLTLADCEGVFVQLSGLSMFAPYPYAGLDELIRATVRAFGAERMCWGSNYPVCGSDEAYARDLQQVLGGAWGLGSRDVREVTERTAARVWFDFRF